MRFLACFALLASLQNVSHATFLRFDLEMRTSGNGNSLWNLSGPLPSSANVSFLVSTADAPALRIKEGANSAHDAIIEEAGIGFAIRYFNVVADGMVLWNEENLRGACSFDAIVPYNDLYDTTCGVSSSERQLTFFPILIPVISPLEFNQFQDPVDALLRRTVTNNRVGPMSIDGEWGKLRSGAIKLRVTDVPEPAMLGLLGLGLVGFGFTWKRNRARV